MTVRTPLKPRKPDRADRGGTAIVIDDHQLFSAGMERLLLPLDAIREVFRYATPLDIPPGRLDADVALIVTDFYIPGVDMLEWIARFAAHRPPIPVAVVSSSTSRSDRNACMQAGAKAYFQKHYPPEHVLAGLMALLGTDDPPPDEPPAVQENTVAGDLTQRQVDVLVQLARGFSLKEIAIHLSISPETVKTHLAQIYAKIEVSGRSAASKWARDQGLV